MNAEQRPTTGRGAPLVATWARWSGATACLVAAMGVVLEGCLRWSRSEKSFRSFGVELVVCGVLLAGIAWTTLRAEELRLARELRTARAGTSVLRGMLARRRQQSSLVSRLLTTRLGTAAMLLADGDRAEALDAFDRSSPLMRGGRLEKVRRVVEADLERAAGGQGALERSAALLRSMAPVGNREADLYRLHVLVKALLEQGDVENGAQLAELLATSKGEDERVYLAWLLTWFELDGSRRGDGGYFSQGELRMAILQARSQGAEMLVEKLEERLAAIAPGEERK